MRSVVVRATVITHAIERVMVVNDLHSDVIVVGAGIIGASCAYHLASKGLSVTVLEALAGTAQGSTGLSFSSIRGQWTDALNIELSWRSICTFRSFPEDHGVDVGYRPSGYLFLVPPSGWEAQLAAVELQRAHGVPVDVLDVAAANRITPFNADGIAGATWGSSDGLVDPHLATSAFADLARHHGATFLFRNPVVAIEADTTDGGWRVSTAQHHLRAQYIVNAAGGWAGEVAALAGLHVPVVHSRRNVYATAVGALPHELPMTVDFTSGVYLRSEGPRLLFGGAKPGEVDGYNTSVDWDWMEPVLEHATARFPWMADLPIDRSAAWAGTYENSPDLHGILGPDPTANTWINACGFSGHGMMQGPELGRLVVEQITTGTIASIDTTPLKIERFATSAQEHRVGTVF